MMYTWVTGKFMSANLYIIICHWTPLTLRARSPLRYNPESGSSSRECGMRKWIG